MHARSLTAPGGPLNAASVVRNIFIIIFIFFSRVKTDLLPL
jgi:hypothetical protein